MKKYKAILLDGLVLLTFTPQKGNGSGRASNKPAAAASAGLWQKALSIYRKNREWYPEKITILSEILNRQGQPYSVTQLFFTINRDPGGSLHTVLARSLKNGKDTTKDMKSKVTILSLDEEVDPNNEGTYSVSISDSPFDPERQEAVAFHASGEKQFLFGHMCAKFDFSYQTEIIRKGEKEKLCWKGMAWLDEASGIPVKLEFSIDPLPRRIRSIWAIYLYDMANPEKWVVKRVDMAGQGGFLFIRKRFRNTTTFTDYQRQLQKEDKK
jgi:hypothetical protein